MSAVTGVLVPLTNTPNQRLTVTLPINGGALSLRLRLYYNEDCTCWMMDISNHVGTLLVASVPLLTGVWPVANILAPYDYLRIGSAFLINQSGGNADRPDAFSLGREFILIWDSN